MKLIECPRDAMQGIKEFIPTDKKAQYINALLEVGFDTIDFGSFVSPKAIPQMADTAEVLARLDMRKTKSKLLAIVANERGADEAVRYAEISYLGFPLSISETFQKRNTNKSIEEALQELENIHGLCVANNKTLVTYLSMGFGNPYGDPYDVGIVEEFADKLNNLGVKIISLADTTGVSNKEDIHYLFKSLTFRFPDVEFGAHLHSTPQKAIEKIEAAYKAGCRRFDSAMKGFGGCPMANDDLVGNIASEELMKFFKAENIQLPDIDQEKFMKAYTIAGSIFL
jgi:hydroxymethylglutaryl-CoA lyase